jgi:hypothetical protein
LGEWPRAWWPKRGRTLGWNYDRWLKAVSDAALAGSPEAARKTISESLVGLAPAAVALEDDRAEREKWRAYQRESASDDAFKAARARELEAVACASEFAPYVAGRIALYRPTDFSTALARKMLGGAKAGCPGAEGISAGMRERLQEIIDEAKKASAESS